MSPSPTSQLLFLTYSNVAHIRLCIKSKRESAPTGSRLVCDGSAAQLFVSEVVEDLRCV